MVFCRSLTELNCARIVASCKLSHKIQRKSGFPGSTGGLTFTVNTCYKHYRYVVLSIIQGWSCVFQPLYAAFPNQKMMIGANSYSISGDISHGESCYKPRNSQAASGKTFPCYVPCVWCSEIPVIVYFPPPKVIQEFLKKLLKNSSRFYEKPLRILKSSTIIFKTFSSFFQDFLFRAIFGRGLYNYSHMCNI